MNQMTMNKVLLITNKEDVTIDFIVKELQRRNVKYYRLNTEDIPEKITTNFDLFKNHFSLYDHSKQQEINILDYDSVYFRRPKISTLSHIEGITQAEIVFLKRELTSLLEGLYCVLERKFWLNNVFAIRKAENKLQQLLLAREIGFNTPYSLISNDYSQITSFVLANKSDCILKPIKSGALATANTSKVIFTSQLDHSALDETDRLESFPLFFQNHIEKTYDLRCTVIGKQVFSAEIHSQVNPESQVDWRKANSLLEHKKHLLPVSIANKCVALTQKMGLNYSAIDLIFDKNHQYQFLELNPNGQWAWIEKRLGYPLSKRIVDLLTNHNEKHVYS